MPRTIQLTVNGRPVTVAPIASSDLPPRVTLGAAAGRLTPNATTTRLTGRRIKCAAAAAGRPYREAPHA